MVSSITMAGLDLRYTDAPPPAANTVALSFRDTGVATEAASLRLERSLSFTDTGTSVDRAALRVEARLGFTDIGTGIERASLSVDGAPHIVQLGFRDTGAAEEQVSIGAAPVRLAFYDLGQSNETAFLSDLATPVTRPVVGPVAEEAYAGLGPYTEGDEATGWHLLHFIAALTKGIQETDDLIRDSDIPGWAAMLDADRTPVGAIDWLGQFVGVDPAPGAINEEGRRLRLKEASGFKRGTPNAIRGAARQSLTGRKRVQLFERDGSAYRLRVVVFASETPDVDLTRKLVMAAKPAGIYLQFVVAAGMSYDDLKATGLKYNQLINRFPTYDAMRAALPAGDA
jgi:hypothetical protein